MVIYHLEYKKILTYFAPALRDNGHSITAKKAVNIAGLDVFEMVLI